MNEEKTLRGREERQNPQEDSQDVLYLGKRWLWAVEVASSSQPLLLASDADQSTRRGSLRETEASWLELDLDVCFARALGKCLMGQWERIDLGKSGRVDCRRARAAKSSQKEEESTQPGRVPRTTR